MREHSPGDAGRGGPEEAIRELLINAVLHRAYDVGNMPTLFYWYSDHVEILNPGGLFGTLTADKFGKRTSYRNEVLAEAMKGFGYVLVCRRTLAVVPL